MKQKLVIIFCVLQLLSVAQFKQDTSKNLSYIAIPIVFSTPEMGFGYGLSGSVSFNTSYKNDPETRNSIIQAMGIFTTRHQNVQFIDASLFFPKEKYILYLQCSHSYFPDRFWGIGPNTRNEDEEKYAFKQYNFFPHFKKKIFKRTFAGLIYEYQRVYKTHYLEHGVFDTSHFYGKNPYQVSGAGFSLSYDSRNSAAWPTKGIYMQSSYERYDRLLGSDYELGKWITDIRYYYNLVAEHIIAFQGYFYFTHGQTPLRELANFGGATNMRGFYQGRFRDKSMYSLIGEYRAPIYGRLSVVGFAGMGSVYSNDYRIALDKLKFSFGAGLRFAMLKKERLNLRLDFGYADNKNYGFYFTAGECF